MIHQFWQSHLVAKNMNDAKLEACTKPVKTKKPNTSPKVVAQRHRKMVGLVSGAVGNLDSGGSQSSMQIMCSMAPQVMSAMVCMLVDTSHAIITQENVSNGARIVLRHSTNGVQ